MIDSHLVNYHGKRTPNNLKDPPVEQPQMDN